MADRLRRSHLIYASPSVRVVPRHKGKASLEKKTNHHQSESESPRQHKDNDQREKKDNDQREKKDNDQREKKDPTEKITPKNKKATNPSNQNNHKHRQFEVIDNDKKNNVNIMMLNKVKDADKRDNRHTMESPRRTHDSPSTEDSNNRGITIRKPQNLDNKDTLDTVASLRKTLRSFHKKHLSNGGFDYPECARCLEEVVDVWGMGAGVIADPETFLNMALQKPLTEDIMDSDEYFDLLSIAHRDREFNSVVSDVQKKLSRRLNKHVTKSCTSLKEESNGVPSAAADEYEHAISGHKSDLAELREKIDEGCSRYKQGRSPFSEHVAQGEGQCDVMEEVCGRLVESLAVVEAWVRQDGAYPEKLTKEIYGNTRIIEGHREDFDMNRLQLSENYFEIDRLQKGEKRAAQAYTESKHEKDALKARLYELGAKRNALEYKVNKMKGERDAMQAESSELGSSPREADTNAQKIKKVDSTIERLQGDKRVLSMNIRRVERDLKPAGDKTYEHKVDFVDCKHRRQEIEKENIELVNRLEKLQRQFVNIEKQNATLRRMREMKMSPEAFRKGVRLRRREEVMKSSGLATLTEACSLAAPSIGKDWKTFYLRLPFDPPRDVTKRQNDVTKMDYVCQKNDVTVDEQAVQSLSKWRSFHRRGHVTDLIQTLRDARRSKVARQLHHRFILNASG